MIPRKLTYPVIPMRVPDVLVRHGNGKLPPRLLKRTLAGGLMWSGAADGFNAMFQEAKKAGIIFKNIGDYRSLQEQEALFYDRYTLLDQGRIPKITRKYKNKVWYLKKGKSPAGVPGTSNHGWGLAIDLGTVVNGNTVSLSANKKALKWLCENAPKYGFYLQVSDPNNPEFENWHWQYCAGTPYKG